MNWTPKITDAIVPHRTRSAGDAENGCCVTRRVRRGWALHNRSDTDLQRPNRTGPSMTARRSCPAVNIPDTFQRQWFPGCKILPSNQHVQSGVARQGGPACGCFGRDHACIESGCVPKAIGVVSGQVVLLLRFRRRGKERSGPVLLRGIALCSSVKSPVSTRAFVDLAVPDQIPVARLMADAIDIGCEFAGLVWRPV